MPGIVTQGNMNGYGYDYGRGPYNDDYRNPYGRSEFRGPDDGRINSGYSHDPDSSFEMRDPVFEVDHLATYTSRSGPMNVEDGLRKLKQMENTTGIWTMRCELIVENRDIVIVDKGNGEEQERFPLSTVMDPTAVVDDKKQEVYSNLILFTVVEDPGSRYSSADMHIFQSTDRLAPSIVDEILAAKEGRRRTGVRPPRPMNMPPPPREQPPNPPFGQNYGRSRWIGREFGKSHFNYSSGNDPYPGRGLGNKNLSQPEESPSSLPFQARSGAGFLQASAKQWSSHEQTTSGSNYGDISPPSFSSPPSMSQHGYMRQSLQRANYDMDAGDGEALEKDVQLLNCCFDDIEKFVSRLQAAAEAYKELDKRRRERRGKGKFAGDGLLNMKARPPPPEDFIDIFKKFKFAFNLLAKLKAHIHDPNAPELVHFLFTPLSLIYEASRDPVHGGMDLADRARPPLLTAEAKQLLLNCLTSKELDLWQQLGRNWTQSSDDMNVPNEPFYPRFYNGWTPAPINLENKAKFESAAFNMNHQIEQRNQYQESRREVDDMIAPYPRMEGFRKTERQEPLRPMDDDPYARSNKHLPLMQPSPAPPGALPPNPNVAKYQDYVEKHIDRNQRVHKSRTREEENQAFEEKLRDQNAQLCEIVHEREGRNAKEISVKKGDIVQVLDNSRNWWKVKNCYGDVGYAPYTIMKDITTADRAGDRVRNSGDYNSYGPPPPSNIPEPPPVPQNSRVLGRQEKEIGRPGYGEFENEIAKGESHDSWYDKKPVAYQSPPHHSFQERPTSHSRSSSGSYDGAIRRGSKDMDRQRKPEDSYQDRNILNNSFDKVREERRRSGGQNRTSPYHEERDDSFERVHDWKRENKYGPPHGKEQWRQEEASDRWKAEHKRQDPVKNSPPLPSSRPPLRGKPDRLPIPERRTEDLHSELVRRVSSSNLLSQGEGNTYYITKNSDAKEVKDWLITKVFSRHCIKTLTGYNGSELFAMTRKEMDRLLGKDEGHTLESLLTVQKKISNYGTQGGSELRKILEQRKKQSEEVPPRQQHMGQPPSFSPESPDYSDSESDTSSEDFSNAGKTLRALLQHQRRKINDTTYQQSTTSE